MKRVIFAGLGFSHSTGSHFPLFCIGLGTWLMVSSPAFGGTTIHICDQPSLVAAIAAGGDIVFECDGTIVLTNTLIIERSVSLDGAGHAVVISGNDVVRLFQVNRSADLQLKHLILERGRVIGTNGSPETDGGRPPLGVPGGAGGPAQGAGLLILPNSAATVSDCIFRNNKVVGGSGGPGSFPGAGGVAQGGAIYNGGKLYASNTLFLTNTATGGTGGSNGVFSVGNGGFAAGGALYGSAECENCRWLGNSAVGGQRGIGLGAGTSGPASGGAVYSSNFFRARENRFEGNRARSINVAIAASDAGACSGGAVFFAGLNGISLSNSLFLLNQALGGSPDRNGWASEATGGGVTLIGSGQLVEQCRFDNNDAIGGDSGIGAAGRGGAMFNSTTVTVSRTSFSGNYAKGGLGRRSGQFAGASGPGFGGAVYNSGALLVSDSTFTRNIAEGGAGGESTFSGYSAPGEKGFGGAIFNAGSVQATNDTLALNFARGGDFRPYRLYAGTNAGKAYGGGLFNATGSVVLVHCTIANNNAEGGMDVTNATGFGGGLSATNGTITLYNSIVATSTPTNCYGATTDGGGNISSDSSCAFSGTGSLINTDPRLGALDNYGGPTQTMPLLAGSPAIDAALPAACPGLDQRGRTRPFGPQCDMGAFESSPPYVIRGKIRGFFSAGQVSVSNGSDSVATEPDGRYSFESVASGSFSVTPVGTDLLFVPTTRLVALGPDVLDIDFVAYRMNGLLFEKTGSNVFHGIYAGTAGQTIRIESSADLNAWPPYQTNIVGPDGLTDFFTTNGPGTKQKTFRTLILQ